MIDSGPSDGHELRVGSAEGCRQPQEAWCVVRGCADGLRPRLARIFDDPDHSRTEAREIIVGHSARQRLLVVCFVERGERVRIFSARKATRKERKDYENPESW